MEYFDKGRRMNRESLENAIRHFNDRDVLSKVSQKLPESKTLGRKEIIHAVRSSYQNNNLVLVLGAGVSMGFGVPSWSELLQRLLVNTIDEGENESRVLAKLFDSIFQPNPLIAGRYLQKYYLDNKISFESDVKKALYANCQYDSTQKLMAEIVNFCITKEQDPNLNSIITYNFDDILEHKLNDAKGENTYKTIFGSKMNPENGELPIYHVHGFLPKEEKLTDLNQITLGENIYHKQYSDVYSWNNLTQINKFKDNTCLFVGSSLTDPNIRRLLDIAYAQKPQNEHFHYMFKRRYSEESTRKSLRELLQKNEVLMNEKVEADMQFKETVKFLIEFIERFEENDSMSFGVKTIWVDNHDEIPQVLEEIRRPED